MPNGDVRATDTLANERTYLAYIRTALAFVAFGFVVARFALFSREISVIAAQVRVPATGISRVLGIAMVAAGIAYGLYGSWRYAVMDRALREGKNLTLSPSVAYTGAAIVGIIGVIIAVNLFF